MRSGYSFVANDGVTVAIVNRKRILLMKRINIPFLIIHPGMWYFVAGSKDGNESYLANAYREIKEETGIGKSDLRLLYSKKSIKVFDSRRKREWTNSFFIFCSKTDSVSLNFEHTSYRWVSIGELEKAPLMEEFERSKILKLIKQQIGRC
jgi:8-oxo-dGTP pyrophosphatase MutT (NUDIX family)